jgi:hypothetical protein
MSPVARPIVGFTGADGLTGRSSSTRSRGVDRGEAVARFF